MIPNKWLQYYIGRALTNPSTDIVLRTGDTGTSFEGGGGGGKCVAKPVSRQKSKNQMTI